MVVGRFRRPCPCRPCRPRRPRRSGRGHSPQRIGHRLAAVTQHGGQAARVARVVAGEEGHGQALLAGAAGAADAMHVLVRVHVGEVVVDDRVNAGHVEAPGRHVGGDEQREATRLKAGHPVSGDGEGEGEGWGDGDGEGFAIASHSTCDRSPLRTSTSWPAAAHASPICATSLVRVRVRVRIRVRVTVKVRVRVRVRVRVGVRGQGQGQGPICATRRLVLAKTISRRVLPPSPARGASRASVETKRSHFCSGSSTCTVCATSAQAVSRSLPPPTDTVAWPSRSSDAATRSTSGGHVAVSMSVWCSAGAAATTARMKRSKPSASIMSASSSTISAQRASDAAAPAPDSAGLPPLPPPAAAPACLNGQASPLPQRPFRKNLHGMPFAALARSLCRSSRSSSRPGLCCLRLPRRATVDGDSAAVDRGAEDGRDTRVLQRQLARRHEHQAPRRPGLVVSQPRDRREKESQCLAAPSARDREHVAAGRGSERPGDRLDGRRRLELCLQQLEQRCREGCRLEREARCVCSGSLDDDLVLRIVILCVGRRLLAYGCCRLTAAASLLNHAHERVLWPHEAARVGRPCGQSRQNTRCIRLYRGG
eukprot:scaffold16659_cov70-Phaeocystis_antarctica.AAC.1